MTHPKLRCVQRARLGAVALLLPLLAASPSTAQSTTITSSSDFGGTGRPTETRLTQASNSDEPQSVDVIEARASQQTDRSPDLDSGSDPSDAVLQELHDLRAETTRLKVSRRYQEQFAPGGKRYSESESRQREEAIRKLQRIDQRLHDIAQRQHVIHTQELGQYERVAIEAVLDCSEEPRYGQSAYGIILYASSVATIQSDELLLFHAGSVYRTQGEFRPLTTNGQGFYFRPNVRILEGQPFVAACLQNAPEELENVKNGFMPNSDRVRSPQHPYTTILYHRDGKPLQGN